MSKPVVTLEDGNAFAVLAAASNAARAAGWSNEQIIAFRDEAMSGDYQHLLWTVQELFDVRVGSEDECTSES